MTDACPKCHTEFLEDNHLPIECKKCKHVCCTYCIKTCTVTGCPTNKLCEYCYEHHQIAKCKDCDKEVCNKTSRQRTYFIPPIKRKFRRSHLHNYCKKCKKYTCLKQPQVWIIRHLKSARLIKTHCVDCLWLELTCYNCRRSCSKCPFICKICDKLFCEQCEAHKKYSKIINTCTQCESNLRQKVIEKTQYNYNKIRLAYIRKFIKYESPRIRPLYFKLFIEPYMMPLTNIKPYNIELCAFSINYS